MKQKCVGLWLAKWFDEQGYVRKKAMKWERNVQIKEKKNDKILEW